MSEFCLTTMTLNDFSVKSWEGGSGPTLLFLHGAGGAADMLTDDAPAAFLTDLARFFRVIVTEHPGFGSTDRPAWLDNIHDLAYFYLDYLAARDLDGVHLVGQSLGGWLALEIAVRSTARLASLTVAGAAGVQVRGVPKGDIFLWSRDDFVRNMFRNPDAAEAFQARVPTPEQQKASLRNSETTALLAWEPRLVDPHLHKWLHRIDVPTHVIWAADDAVLPRPYGEAIVSLIDGSHLTVIESAGHLLHMDQPAAFSAAVRRCLEETVA